MLPHMDGVGAADRSPGLVSADNFRRPRWLQLALLVGAILLIAYCANAALGIAGPGLDRALVHWLWNGLFFLAAGLCIARAVLVRAERAAWLLFGFGLALFGGGWVYYDAVIHELSSPPFPSLADGMWLAFYPLSYAGLVLLLRERMQLLAKELWLDGVIGALAVAALAAAFVFQPLLEATGASASAVVTQMTHALADLQMFGFLLGVIAASGWRAGRGWCVMTVGFAAAVVGDCVFAYEVPSGTFELGGLLDATWPAMALAIAYAAWQPPASIKPLNLQGSRLLLVPACFVALAVLLHVYGSFAEVNGVAALLASATLVAGAARTYGAYREMRRLEAAVGRDPLTGLLNHREFHAAVDRELDRVERDGGRFSIAMFDLDGFKRVNDSYGHAAGDELLRRVASEIERVSRATDAACRLGGDEFGLVLPGAELAAAERAGRRIEAAIEAMKEPIGVSFGVAEWPDDGPTKELLLLRADTALYAAKPGSDRQRLEAAASAASRAVTELDSAAPASTGQPSHAEAVEQFLKVAREQLQMDLALVGEFKDGEEVFRSVEGDGESFGVEQDGSLPLEHSYCQRMVDGRLPNVVKDASREKSVKDLAATHEADIGSYVGVPLRFSDGRLYGALCCVGHSPDPALSERDLAFMRVIGELIAAQLEQGQLADENRRLHVEAAGIQALLAAVEARDDYTGEHSRTVVNLASNVARDLGLSGAQVAEVEQVALLHDLGKVGIPDSILKKPGKLSEDDWRCMREHPVIGERIVASIAGLAHLARAIRAEHERWDGTGYPDGLIGEQIPLASRIVFACDAYHAMTSDRPYRSALSSAEAMAELEQNAGAQFDPVVVRALLALVSARGFSAAQLADRVASVSSPRSTEAVQETKDRVSS